MKHSTSTPRRSSLLSTLLALLVEYRTAFDQERTFHRMHALVIGFLCSLGRHTLTQALLALGCHDADWSPFYRLFSKQRIVIPRLQRRLIQQCLAHSSAAQSLMLAVDATHFPRSSKRFPGVAWRKAPATAPWRPGLSLAQRFGALHWLTPLEHGFSRAIPLISYPLFPPKATPAAEPPMTEWAGALHALTTLRTELAAHDRAAQPIVLLGDGSYDVSALWKALPAHTALVVRTARNRVLYQLPSPSPVKRRGAKRKYGELAPTPSVWIDDRRGWQTKVVMVRGHARVVRVRVEGPFLRREVAAHPVFLVVMGGQKYGRHGRSKRRNPVPVLVSAQASETAAQYQLPLPLDELVVWLWQRWEVEVAHRELKSGFGVGEMQCWHPRSAIATVQWGIWLYGVCLLAAYKEWGLCGGPQPPGRWRKRARRWSFATVWRGLRIEGGEFGELSGVRTGMRGDWATKEAWMVSLSNGVRSAARL
jgi:DDE superfamily endonuclease